MFDKSTMRFHDPLDDVLGNRIQVRLLRILARTESRGFTGRDLARMCGSSASQATASLRKLEDSGLIVRDIAGRSHVWRIAERHTLVPALRSLFHEEGRSTTALKSDIEELIRKLPVKRAVLFGSVARGDEGPTSDVDLMLTVRSPADKEQVEETLSAASLRFAIKFGNPLSALVLEERHLRSPPNPALLTNIRHDGVELETGT
jgi:predicted nucleotidyltransferase